MGRRRRRMIVMRRGWRGRGGMRRIQKSMVVQEDMIVKFPLVPVASFTAPA